MSDFLHKLWRTVPHPLRRSVFGAASRLAVPRLGPLSGTDGPFTVVGAMRSPTGLGEAARLTARALVALGKDVRVADLTEALKQPAVVAIPALPPPDAGPGTMLVFGNPPVSSYALAKLPRAILRGKTRIGCWVWEYPEVPAAWRKDAALFHAIAAPSAFSERALRATLDLPVFRLPYPFMPRGTASAPRQRAETFHIGFVGDIVAAAERKNPAAVIRAAAHAFPHDETVRLTLVLNGASGPSKLAAGLHDLARQLGVTLTIDGALLDQAGHRARLAGLDAYVSLHRAEGLGLTMIEAMAEGVPVVATAAPPVDEFLTDETGYPVQYRRVTAPPLIDTPAPGLWAEPDVASAAAALKALRADPVEAARRSAAASRRLETLYGLQAFDAALAQGLNSLRQTTTR